MKKKLLFSIGLVVTMTLQINAQTNYDYSKLSREHLNRGVVAVKTTDGKVAVSWRTLKSDPKGQAYDVYRNGKKLNAKPLKTGGTFFVDNQPLKEDATYEVRGGKKNGSFTLKAKAPVGYLPIAIQKPEGGKVPMMQQPQRSGNNTRRSFRNWRDEGFYDYTANDASVGDVDGDGQYEIFLKWEPTNARDNSHDGYTGPVLIDCYRLDGTHLWRVNLGRNIRAGAHYTQFMVYDFNGDGRAEMMVKTADGTIDGEGTVIGDSAVDYRNSVGRILDGPEYLSVFDGLTGRVLDTKPYIAERGDVSAWGDKNGNRSDRFLAAVGYLDGKRPSAIFCRGYYTRSVLCAWNWDGKKLTTNWVFDTNAPGWHSYAGQGNHNLRVADVDGDGCDEITYGSMCVDHDSRGLYNTGMGHGDAIHLIADPKDNKLYIWDCHENRRDGSDLRDARTGKVVFQVKSKTDVGRCMAADIDPTNPGCEMWSADSHGIRNMKGEIIQSRPTPNPSLLREGNNYSQGNNTVMELSTPLPQQGGVGGESRISMNFGIWWDGDLLRELLDRSTVSKYDWQNRQIVDLQKFDGSFNNGTKSNPCLSADILGDWREEVLIRNSESTELRLYVTTIPTDYRIDCLMEDIPYRLSVATQNVAYNQPSELGYYIGPDRTDYLK